MNTISRDDQLIGSPIMTRRGFLRACTIVSGLMLTGCGRTSVRKGQTVLTQWYHEYGQAGTQEAVLRYAKEYTILNPNVAIEIVWTPGDYGTKLSTALLTSEGPDIFECQLTAPMVTAGQVAPLDDLFDVETRSDFRPQDLGMNSVGGKIYGVKSMDDTGVLYYRPSVLARAGIEPPLDASQLLSTISQLTKGDTKGIYLGNDGGISALLTILPWSAGSDFLVDGKIVFNNDRTQAAYSLLRSINTSGSLLIGAPTDWWEPSALIQGLAAMQWSGLWAYPQIRASLGNDVGITSWPALDSNGQPTTFLGGWSTMVNGQSTNIEEAKRYLKWLWIDNKKVQRDWCLGYGFHIPPRISVANSAAELRVSPVDIAVTNVNKHGQYLPPEWSSSMNTALTDALTNIVKLGANPSDELDAADAKCKREIERAQD